MGKTTEHNVVVTDLHRRTTGVSATIRTLVPYIEEQEPLALVSTFSEPNRGTIGLWKALRLCRQAPVDRDFRIWHARRNQEMFWGLFGKHILRCKLKLIITSCALRRHSWLPRKFLASMDAVIATSEEAAKYFDHVEAIIPHGVDCDRFRPPSEEKMVLMKQLGLPSSLGIGICGRIRPEKGTDLFVDALIELLPHHPKFIACIAGRTAPEFESFRRNLQRKISDAGLANRFFWMGEIDYQTMPLFHSAMSLCVAPARYEGYGLVPLEAMASGVPAVCSRTGCYSDAILPAKTGDLFDCGDLSGLAAALERLMSAPKRLVEMGDACRNRVERCFSARTEAQQIVDVYHELWRRAA